MNVVGHDGDRVPADADGSESECSADCSADEAFVAAASPEPEHDADMLEVGHSRPGRRISRMSRPTSRGSSQYSVMSSSREVGESPPSVPRELPEKPKLKPNMSSSAKSRSTMSQSTRTSAAPVWKLNHTDLHDEDDDDDDDAAGPPATGKAIASSASNANTGRKKAVQSIGEAQSAFKEYKSDFTAFNMYKGKVKLRELNTAVERLRKIGNKVACMEGDEAADLAGQLVTFADGLRPIYDLMDICRNRPSDLLVKMKLEQVNLFKTLDANFQHQLLSSVALSILGKLSTSSAKVDDVHAAMEFISGHKYSVNNVEAQLHLKHLSSSGLAAFEKAQSHVLVVLLEALLKLTKVEFVKMFRKLRSEGLAPTLENHEAGKAAWASSQAWFDISACSFMAYILESEEVGFKQTRLFYSGLARLSDIKESTSVRLRTFRGAKKSSGDGDIGRFAWKSLRDMRSLSDGPTSEAVRDATNTWTQIIDNNVLPFTDEPTTAEVKATFINAYEKDLDHLPLALARQIAQLGAQTEVVSELAEAETALQLGMSRYWQVLSEEVTAAFINNTKAKIAGDTLKYDFKPEFNTVLELIKQYDDITPELNPRRSASVAISELRERLTLAGEAFELNSRISLDPCADVEAWSALWTKHLMIQNTRPNAEFVVDCPKVQALLTMLREGENSIANLIQSFSNIHMEFGTSPDSTLIAKCQKLKGQLPENVAGMIDRAAVIHRIRKFTQDSGLGRTIGPCEITCLKSEAGILKGFENKPGCQEHLDQLNAMWTESCQCWKADAKFDDFNELHEFFSGTYKALESGNISGHEWLESCIDDTDLDAKIKKYQDYGLRALQVKVAATSMAQHVMDEFTAAEIDEILKASTDIVSKARSMELNLGAVVIANTVLAKPRSKTFLAEFQSAKHFCHVTCKVKSTQLPKFVQTLLEVESQSQNQGSNSKTGAAKSAATLTATADASSSSSLAAVDMQPKESVPAPAARKKQKLA